MTTGGSVQDYIFNAHAVGSDTNAITHDASIMLHVIDFSLTAPSPATVTANRPTPSNTTSFQVTAAGSFSQAVTLTCSGLPTGATCNFLPSATVNPTSGTPVTVTLSIGTANNTPTGSSTVTISATTAGAPGPKTRSLTLTVTALPDYVLAISNPSISTLVNQIATFNGTVTATNGYTGSVTLSCGTGAPPNCTFNPSTIITPTASGTPFTVTVGSNVAQNYSFNISGNGAGAFRISQAVPVSFDSLSDFTMGSTPATQSLKPGQALNYAVSFTPVGGLTFSNAVTYTCSVTPVVVAGPTCVFSPPSPINAGAGSSSVTLTVTTLGPNAIAPGSSRNISWVALSVSVIGLLMGGLARKSEKSRARVLLTLLLLPTISLLSCGGGGGGGGGGGPPPPPPPMVSVTISPTAANLFTTSPPTQFNATVNNTSNTQVTWQVAGTAGGNATVGTISTSGLYTPPSVVPPNNPFAVTAVSQADTSKSASAMVSIGAPTPSQTYTITVNAVSGPAVHQTTATLVVQ